jgi:hypothetical protein
MKALKGAKAGLKRWGAQDDASFQMSDRQEADRQYVVTRDGEPGPYTPIFTIEIPLKALIIFTKELATFLAQPVDREWDGSEIQPLSHLQFTMHARSGS